MLNEERQMTRRIPAGSWRQWRQSCGGHLFSAGVAGLGALARMPPAARQPYCECCRTVFRSTSRYLFACTTTALSASTTLSG